MACLVKRSNGLIDKVLLEDGVTESKLYKQIVEAIENMSEDVANNVIASVEPLIGKYIMNATDPAEIALGMYLSMYGKKFTDFYGQPINVVEPTLTMKDGEPVFTNTDGKTISLFDIGKVARSKQEYFRSVKTHTSKVLIESVSKTVKVLRQRIDQAKKARDKFLNNPELTFEEKAEKRKYYNDIIKKTSDQIEAIIDANSLVNVAIQAKTDLDMVKSILSDKETTFSDLRLANRVLDSWRNMEMLLGVDSLSDLPEEDDVKMFIDFKNQANNLNDQLKQVAVNLLTEVSKQRKDGFELTRKDILKLQDISALVANVRDISTTGVKLADYLAKLLNEANLKIDKEHNRNYKLIDEVFEKLKDNPTFKSEGFDLFIKEQTNKLGITGLGLIDRYSQDYYEALRNNARKLRENLKKAKDDNAKINAAYQAYHNWISTNTVMFDSRAFTESDKFTDEDRLKVIDDMKAYGYTEDEVADLIRLSQRLYKKYIDAKKYYEIGLRTEILKGDLEIPEGMTEDELIKEKVEKWDELNNPNLYLDQVYNQPKITAYNGGRFYVYKVPRKNINGKNTGYFDEKFTRISSDPQLYEFYKFFKDFIHEQLSYLPEEELEDLQSNFLPVITERLAKEFGFNLLESTKGVGEWFLKSLTAVDKKSYIQTSPVTGKQTPTLRPKFINEAVDAKDRSKDLVLMMKLFSDMAIIYKHKLQIADQVDTINELIQTADRSFKQDDLGNEIPIAEAPKNLQGSVQSEILKGFYGIAPESNIPVKGRKFYNAWELLSLGFYKSPKYKRAKEIEARSKEINNKLENEVMIDKERTKLEEELGKLRSEYTGLGGRELSVSASGDSLIKGTRLVALGLQPFSAIRNLAVGKLNNFIHAAAKQDFTDKELALSYNVIKDATAKYLSFGNIMTEDSEKLLRFMLDTGIIEGEDAMFKGGLMTKKTPLDVLRKVAPSAFTWLKSGDYLFKSQMAVSMALFQKVKTKDGKEVELYKILDKDLNYDSSKYGEWDAEANGGLSFDEYYNKFMLKVYQLSKKLHGLSGSRTSLKGKDTVWGRVLFLFKTWLPETFASRYEGERFDPLLERKVEGYYRTFGKYLFSMNGKSAKQMWKVAFGNQVDPENEVDRANLKKMFREMAVIASLLTLWAMLKGLGGDGDDEDKKRYNLMVNQLWLLERDMTYYGNPFSFEDLQKDVIPVLRTLRNGYEAGKATSYYLLDVENEDGEPMYDGERTALKISKALPVLNNINRIQYYEKQLSDVR